jgi:uncharacterized spore protein YtfJ
MDTNKLKEALQSEVDRLAHVRDELRVQASLAKADTRSELNRLESLWDRVQGELARLGEHAKAPAAELGAAARSLLDELSNGYGRIKRDLEDSGLSQVAQRTMAGWADLATATGLRDAANLQEAKREAEQAATDPVFMRLLERVGGRVGASADARAVFAPPVTQAGVTVIPVARVFGGFGAAFGAGAAADEQPAKQGTGMGGGGGFGAQPVGFIEIDRNGARFRRIDAQVDSWFGVAMIALDVARRAGGWAFDLYKRRRFG